MADRLGIVVRRGPYGRIHAAEALRHAGGAVAKGWEVAVILLGDGVYTAMPYQFSPDGSWISLSDALHGLLNQSGSRLGLYVHDRSLTERGLEPSDIFRQCRVVGMDLISRVLAESGRVLVF